VADIFISYTSKDRDWAEWIGQELEKLGHVAHIDAWEISGGGDIAAWMDERHDKADHILCVVSETYLSKPYSSWERRSGQWAAQTDRPNFVLPVRIEDCKLRTLLASVKYCDLFGMEENEARARLTEFLKPAGKPIGLVPFPGAKQGGASIASPPTHVEIAFPGKVDPERETRRAAISNIPIAVPRHFLGRNDDLAAIHQALNSSNSRAAITALHGLRGVGKTTLAAAFAERYGGQYRATWWIRAETESTMRADLVGLGVRMDWVAQDATEEPAVDEVLERLSSEGERILLIYDNAVDPTDLGKFLPRGTKPHIMITSNAPNWGRIAEPVEIDVWPKETGADFLMARTGRTAERNPALALSEALGGLPLAHDQAAAYCERIGISLAEYKKRFDAAPAVCIDSARDASREYHNGLTVAKTFALAIDEAAKAHPAAKALLVYAALLAPEPIPLFLFSEGREGLSEPFASLIRDNGVDEAVAALRFFALADREMVPDERVPDVVTDCIRLHRLVRLVAASSEEHQWDGIRRALIAALMAVYPLHAYRRPEVWPKIRRLDALAMALVESLGLPLEGTEELVADMLLTLGAYRHYVLGSYLEARPLYERALSIAEEAFGHGDRRSLVCTTFLAILLKDQGDLVAARPIFERVLEMNEAVSGPDHLDTASALNNLGTVLEECGDLEVARSRYERALRIRESQLGPEHPSTALIMGNIGNLLYKLGDLVAARPMFERALAIREKTIGHDHPEISANLLGLCSLFFAQRDLAKALQFSERALNMDERIFAPEHPRLRKSAQAMATVLTALGRTADAAALREKLDLDVNEGTP
jgi:tetratricopeptide (TPR) repeat protein